MILKCLPRSHRYTFFFSVIGIFTLLLTGLQVFLTAELLGDSYQYICYVHPSCPEPLLPDRISTYYAYFLVHKLAYLIKNPSLSFRLVTTIFFFICAISTAASTAIYSPRGKLTIFFVALTLFCVLPGVSSTFSSLYPTAISATFLSTIFLTLCLSKSKLKYFRLINTYFALFTICAVLLVISKSTSIIPGLFLFLVIANTPNVQVYLPNKRSLGAPLLFFSMLVIFILIFYAFVYEQGNANLILESFEKQYYGRYGMVPQETLIQSLLLRFPPVIFFIKEPIILLSFASVCFLIKSRINGIESDLKPILFLQLITCALYLLQLIFIYIVTARSGPPILNYITEPLVLITPILTITIRQSLRNFYLLIACSSIAFTICLLTFIHHTSAWSVLQTISIRESALYQLRLSNLLIIPFGVALALRQANAHFVIPSRAKSIGLSLLLLFMCFDLSFVAIHEMLWRRNLAYAFDQSSNSNQLFHFYPELTGRKNYLRYLDEHHRQRFSVLSLYP